ncbi:MAG: hypothetical protein OYL92_12490 [Acidobacteriota bacterium]|nr:hypothetical protein [Acidobacteriota bacterium]MDE3265778.1 hypothetical protein [Acidobacteriota bacterium]
MRKRRAILTVLAVALATASVQHGAGAQEPDGPRVQKLGQTSLDPAESLTLAELPAVVKKIDAPKQPPETPGSVASPATVARRYQHDDGTFESGIDSQGYVRQTAQRFELRNTGRIQWLEACFWRANFDTNPNHALAFFVHYDRNGRPGTALHDGTRADGRLPENGGDECIRASVSVPVAERTIWVSVVYYGDYGIDVENVGGFGKYISVDTDTAGRSQVLIREIDENDLASPWVTPEPTYSRGSVGIRVGTLEDDGSAPAQVSFIGDTTYQFLNSSGTRVTLGADRIENAGSTTTGDLHLRFWATAGSNPIGRGYVLADYRLGSLGPGQFFSNVEVTTSVDWPPEGTYYLHVFVAEQPELLTFLDSRTFPRPVTFRNGRVSFADGPSGGRGNLSNCIPTGTTLRLGDYRVRMCYETVDGVRGPAYDWGMNSRQSGLAYFFDRDNAEVLVKVLDGCGVNGYYWVFVAPVTDLGLNLYIEDSRGRQWTYRNRIGIQAATSSDVSAFRCN